jgi:predicted PolB exonuclease-like 3'-5' exonuclease
MKPSVIAWDLETVPDLAGFAAANGLVGKSDVEVREAMGDKFPKHIYHSIVCIGALIAHRKPDHWAVDVVGAPHVGERTEKQLIAAFCSLDAAESSGDLLPPSPPSKESTARQDQARQSRTGDGARNT